MILTAPTLASFLEDLRIRHRFVIGVREHLRAEQLRRVLVQSDTELKTSGWIDHLAPILCSSSEEQTTFREAFGEFVEALSSPPPPPADTQSWSEVETPSTRSKVRKLAMTALHVAMILLLVVLAAAGTYYLLVYVGNTKPGDPSKLHEPFIDLTRFRAERPELLATAALLPWALVGLFLWWRRDHRLSLRRAAATLQNQMENRFGMAKARHFPPAQVARHLWTLQRRWSSGISIFAVQLSIRVAARRAGYAEPQMVRRTMRPSYLLFIRQQGLSDHLAAAGFELAQLLTSVGVDLETYVYFNHPAYVTRYGEPTDGLARETVPVEAVLEAHPGAVVLIVEDGAGLVDSLTLELLPWAISLLADRTLVAVMSSAVIKTWGARERALNNAGFLVVSCDGSGLVEFCRAVADLQREDVSGVSPATYAAEQRSARLSLGSYPTLLRTNAETFTGRQAPPAPVVAELIEGLRDYLGAQGFLWLAGLAVYPQLNAELTRTIGVELAEATDAAVQFDAQTYLALAKLPWLIRGYMPDWMRRSLLAALSSEDGEKVQQAVGRILANRLAKGGVSLPWGRPGNLWRRTVDFLRRPSQRGDSVFAQFMSRSRTALSVAAPDWLIREVRLRWWSRLVVPSLLVLAAALSMAASLTPAKSLETIVGIVLLSLAVLTAGWNLARAHLFDDVISPSCYFLTVVILSAGIVVVIALSTMGKEPQDVLFTFGLCLAAILTARHVLREGRLESQTDELAARLEGLLYSPFRLAILWMAPGLLVLATLEPMPSLWDRAINGLLRAYVLVAIITLCVDHNRTRFLYIFSLQIVVFTTVVFSSMLMMYTLFFAVVSTVGISPRMEDIFFLGSLPIFCALAVTGSMFFLSRRFSVHLPFGSMLISCFLYAVAFSILTFDFKIITSFEMSVPETSPLGQLLRTPITWLWLIFVPYVAARCSLPRRIVILAAGLIPFGAGVVLLRVNQWASALIFLSLLSAISVGLALRLPGASFSFVSAPSARK